MSQNPEDKHSTEKTSTPQAAEPKKIDYYIPKDMSEVRIRGGKNTYVDQNTGETREFGMEERRKMDSNKLEIKAQNVRGNSEKIKNLREAITKLDNELKNSLLDSIFLESDLEALNPAESILKAKNYAELEEIPELLAGSKKLTDPSFKTSRPGEPDVFEIGSKDAESVVILGDNVIADSKWKVWTAKKLEILSTQGRIALLKEKIADLKKLKNQVENPQ